MQFSQLCLLKADFIKGIKKTEFIKIPVVQCSELNCPQV